MAILLLHQTRCRLCGDVITESVGTVAFPAFIWNEADPLWIFTDAVFHDACFQMHPLATHAMNRYEELSERSGPGNRECVVCRTEVTDPDDYLFTGHFTDDPDRPLHAFNYLSLHRSCIPLWSEREELGRLIRELRDSGRWKGPWLDIVLEAIIKGVQP